MRHVRLLRALRGSFGLTDVDIARQLDIPRASVRRLVHELRAYHVRIVTNGGFYRLEE